MKKFLCFRNVLLSCLAFCLMLVPVVSNAAPVTYSYMGNNYESYYNSSYVSGEYTSDMHVGINLTTLNGPLPDGASYDVRPFLSSWIFVDGRNRIDPDNGTAFPQFWQNVEVSGGEITKWKLSASAGDPFGVHGPKTVGIGISSRYGFTNDHDYSQMTPPEPDAFEASWARVDDPGVWSRSQTPVPEPTTLLLFGAGLVGLAGFGRKKFKK